MAGKKAAEYLQDPTTNPICTIPIEVGKGIRYSVPSQLRLETMEDTMPLRFRVDDIYKDCLFCVYGDDQKIMQRSVRIATPGEMEQILLIKKQLEELTFQRLRIELEMKSDGN